MLTFVLIDFGIGSSTEQADFYAYPWNSSPFVQQRAFAAKYGLISYKDVTSFALN